ncbi:hypothetical protein TNCV_3542821 [Trichonephila clavipes]|nr:hypothetical protein TNCV_3542821 [Trichonephila clavipes]
MAPSKAKDPGTFGKQTGENSPLNLKCSAPFLRHTPSTRRLRSFASHINAAAKRSILGKLCGTSWGSRPQTLKSPFSTVIRPVLEYATPIWTPASISVKRKLDSVQHRAAKIII